MKKLAILLSLCIALANKGLLAQVQTIVNYDFNSASSYPVSPSSTSAGITSSITGSETYTTYVGTATGSSAFTQNATAGNAIAMTNSSGTDTKYFLISLSGTSLNQYAGLQMYLQSQRSSTGAATIDIATSTDGINYTTLGTSATVPTSFGESVISLNSLSGASTIYIKLMASGASGTGTLRIDNIEIQGGLTLNAWQSNGANIYYTNGNVGVNNPNPSTALDVTGSINATQNLSVEGNVSLTGVQDAPTGTITRNLKVDGSGFVYTEPLGVSDGSAGSWDLRGNSSTDETINFLGTTDDHDVIFKTNNIERMRITSHATNPLEKGRVYIGGGDLLADQNDLHGTWDDKLVVKDAIRILDDNTSPSKCAVFGYSNDHTYIESYKITNGDQPPYTQPDDIYMGWNSGANVSISENPSIGTTGGNLTVQHTMTATKIGINNLTPVAQLDITAAGNNKGINISDGTNSIFSVAKDGTTLIKTTSTTNSPFTITSSLGTPFAVKSNGHVVINDGIQVPLFGSSYAHLQVNVNDQITPFLITSSNINGGTTNLFGVTTDGSVALVDNNPDDYNSLLKMTHSNGSTLEFLANGVGDITSSSGLRPHFASEDFTVFEGTPGTGQQRLGISSGGGVVIQTNHATVGTATSLSIVNSTTPVGGGYSIGGTETFAVSDEGWVKSIKLAGTGTRQLYVDNTGTIVAGTASVSSTNSVSWNLGGNNITIPTNTATESFGTNTASDLVFITSGAPRMVLAANGQFGVGTTTPHEFVQIGDRLTIHNGGSKYIGYNSYYDGAAGTNKRFANDYASALTMGNGEFTFNVAGNDAAGSDISFIRALKITSTGLVRVGAKAPTIAPYNNMAFSVDGTIVAREIYVLDDVHAAWADYVFAKDYKLMPLNEVENFIASNKHLPNVPSATEVKEEGKGLGELQVAQMEKIEELYLYVIELNKKVEALKKENEELKESLQNR